MIKKIAVIGGGTAGWLSALFVKQLLPDCKITVIENSSIDIIGVGESTTPPIINLFNFVGIEISDLISNAGATFKTSIKFTNWNGDNDYYFHGFDPLIRELNIYNYSKCSPYSNNDINLSFQKSYMSIFELYHNSNLKDIHVSSVMSQNNKVPIAYEQQFSSEFQNAILHFGTYASYALHFNARLLAEYLKKIGLERGIEVIDDRVLDAESDETGFISSLILEKFKKIDCDFVFDCSGMARVLIEKYFQSSFNSYSKYLPVKKAIPFFIDRTEKTPVFTEAISMKNGWVWKIPVEGRFGCGYVFDSDYINPTQAYDEVVKFFGHDVTVPKVISFTPGYFSTPWNKNVLSVGLSSGFIEPLEATSIWVTTISLFLFAEKLSAALTRDQREINEYNKIFNSNTENILNLVHTHYLNQRNDSDFWKEFRIKNETPETLKSILEIFKYRLPSARDRDIFGVFSEESWLVVAAGNKLFSREVIEKEYKNYNIEKNINTSIFDFKNHLTAISRRCIDHDELIKYLKDRYE